MFGLQLFLLLLNIYHIIHFLLLSMLVSIFSLFQTTKNERKQKRKKKTLKHIKFPVCSGWNSSRFTLKREGRGVAPAWRGERGKFLCFWYAITQRRTHDWKGGGGPGLNLGYIPCLPFYGNHIIAAPDMLPPHMTPLSSQLMRYNWTKRVRWPQHVWVQENYKCR